MDKHLLTSVIASCALLHTLQVYSVGSKTGTFGVPGVREHCYFLKVRFSPVMTVLPPRTSPSASNVLQ
jgi:hypothetical protein